MIFVELVQLAGSQLDAGGPCDYYFGGSNQAVSYWMISRKRPSHFSRAISLGICVALNMGSVDVGCDVGWADLMWDVMLDVN